MVRSWPSPPKRTSWCAPSPGCGPSESDLTREHWGGARACPRLPEPLSRWWSPTIPPAGVLRPLGSACTRAQRELVATKHSTIRARPSASKVSRSAGRARSCRRPPTSAPRQARRFPQRLPAPLIPRRRRARPLPWLSRPGGDVVTRDQRGARSSRPCPLPRASAPHAAARSTTPADGLDGLEQPLLARSDRGHRECSGGGYLASLGHGSFATARSPQYRSMSRSSLSG